jgi:Ca2+-binding RTX toxin-like protein
MTPFVRTDADGNILGRADSKSNAPLNGFQSPLRGSTLAAAPSEIAHHSQQKVTGTLGTEEGDAYSINLVQGQTYTFALRGTPTGGLEDPYLFLLNSTGTVALAQDDDGGLGRSALITYTAPTTGTYLLYASSWYHLDPSAPGYPTADTGNYTIDVWTLEAGHDAGSTRATSTAISVGTTYGYIDTVGDSDVYKIELTAGKVYTFTYNGGVGGESDFNGAVGESIGVLRLLNADGTTAVDYTVNYETGLTFYAEQGGTYYLQAQAYSNFANVPAMTGGYTLDVKEQSLSELDPLESLNWDTAANVPFVNVNGVKTAYVYFGAAGENFGEKGDDGVTPMVTFGWKPHQQAAVMDALKQFEHILGVKYVVTTDASQATFRLLTSNSTQYGAYFYPQDPDYGTQKGIGVFNLLSGGFGTRPESLVQGGFSYAVILHEFGHAHGIAHPHDEGGGSEVLVGVTDATGSFGVFNLNQGVYTVMSYNDAWHFHPDGPTSEHPDGSVGAVIDHGWSGTLSAFDIALLQKRYGVTERAKGDDTYVLNDNYKTAYYQTIWDSGGTDAIVYGGALNAQIDLTAATLDYSPTGGGVVSFLYNSPQPDYTTEIKGGYTIANGVVIENASGGSGNDVLIGNAVSNKLSGNGGNDKLIGNAGGDVMDGGAGFDTASYMTAATGVNVTVANNGKITVTGGDSGDTLISIEAVEGSNEADTFTGGSLGDILFGLGGNDNMSGGNGIDKLDGGAGNDTVDGGNGNDQLFGRAGTDTILGGTGVDIIDGGADGDTLTGGSGADMFIFQSAAHIGKLPGLRDVVKDFQAGVDKIDLSNVFAGNSPVSISFVANAAAAGSGAANTVYVYTEGSGLNAKTLIVGNSDGVAGLDFALELTGKPALKASDFVSTTGQWNDFFAKHASPTDYSAFHDVMV